MNEWRRVAFSLCSPIIHSTGHTYVHVPKSDRSTQSCSTYAITLNPQSNFPFPSNPIPLQEDVFHKLRCGQKYTKLDLKNAYQQLTLDEEICYHTYPLTPLPLYLFTLRYCVFSCDFPEDHGYQFARSR